MKTNLFNMFLLTLIITIGISSCATPTAQAPTLISTAKTILTTTQDPSESPQAKVVLDMVDKLNTGDVDGSLAHFAEDAMSYFIGMPPTGIEVYRGAESLRPTWEYCISDNFRWEVEMESVEDNIVKANTHTYLGFTEGLGVAPNDFVDYFLVEDDKITNYASVMTEESLAEFKPALLAVMPPEPTKPLTDDPVSKLTVTFTDGTCTTPGPMVLKVGELTVNAIVDDTAQEKYAISLFTLDEGKDMVDLMASSMRAGTTRMVGYNLNERANPGQKETYTLNIKEEPVYLVCWAYPFQLPIGNAGAFEVKP